MKKKIISKSVLKTERKKQDWLKITTNTEVRDAKKVMKEDLSSRQRERSLGQAPAEPYKETLIFSLERVKKE